MGTEFRPVAAGENVVDQDSKFQFVKSRHLPGVTVLRATMDGFSYDKHAHEEYAFGVTLSGRQDFFSNGVFHRSEPGNVIQLNPDEVHDGHSGVEDPLSYVMLYVCPGQIDPLFAEAAGSHRRGDVPRGETLRQDPVLRHLLVELARLIEQDVGSRIEQEHLLYRIAAGVAQREGRYQPDDIVGRADRLLVKAKAFIHEHVDADLSLDDLSDAANLSKYHFLRLFRRQFGITPHQYVINCRINAARSALEAGELLNDVVYRYGFSDLSHFNRRFKRIYGMTPRQYQDSVTA